MPVRSQHSEEFRADALELVNNGDRTIKQVAEDLGVNQWTLRTWYRNDMAKRRKRERDKELARGGAKRESVEERLERLERENERLRKENDALRTDRAILKKAAAFFAKENG
jgi:transposase